MLQKHALVPRNLGMSERVTVIEVLILDHSGSMIEYGQTPAIAVNEHIEALKEQTDRRYFSAVVGFADESRIVVPMKLVQDIPTMGRFEPDGYTKLYDTVRTVLNRLMMLHYECPIEELSKLRIVVGVFSDGADNRSEPGAAVHLQNLAHVAQKMGIELLTFGIGIDARTLAEEMGFPTDPAHAVTVSATVRGVTESVRSMTTVTTSLH